MECMVCSDTYANMTFEPCGHMIVCLDCSIKMKKCLLCQTLIEEKLGAGNKILVLVS